MKKFCILLLLIFVLSACVRPAGTQTPTAEPTNPLATYIQAPTAIVLQPTYTLPDHAGGGEDTSAPTEPPEGSETGQPTPFTIKPTNTPTNTLQSAGTPNATTSPESTKKSPKPTDTPAGWQPPAFPPFDPFAVLGGARYIEDFQDETPWKDYYGNMENERIALVIEDGHMRVTGKNSYFRTWWFGGFELGDFYIEMDVNNGDCTFDDSYGVILRGEPSDHGYLFAFDCGGEVAAWRIDSVNDPYVEDQILGWTSTELIRTGANQDNILGVMMEGGEITIYANRYLFTTLYDDTYDYGQYGVFVMAGEDDNYTYTIDQMRVWDVESE
jgi:hypothetical protein